MRIFATTVPAFLPRENPISRNANPACMNITSAPATITHIVFIPTDGSSFPAIDFSRSVASANAEPGTANIAAAAAEQGAPDRVPSSHPIHAPCPPAQAAGGRGWQGYTVRR